MRFLKLAKTIIERAKKLKFYLYLLNRRKRQFTQMILPHILLIIRSKKHPRSIWVTPDGIQRKSGRSKHYSKRVQLLFLVSRSFSFYAFCWMLNVFLVRYYKCVLLKQEYNNIAMLFYLNTVFENFGILRRGLF